MAIIYTTLKEPFQILARGSSTYDAVPHPILLIDHQGIIHHTNQAAWKATGLKKEELLGHHCHNLFHNPDATPEECPVCCAIHSNTSLRGYEMAISDQQEWRLFHITPIDPFKPIGGLVQVVSDISKRKRAETHLLRMNETLERKVRQRTEELEAANQELKEFAYVASHDLQEPLRTLNNYAEFLKEDLEEACLSDAAKEDLRFISESSNRMQILVQDLLQYSRASRIEVNATPVDLEQTMKVVIENLSLSIEESGASVTWKDLPTIQGNATALARVFQNLVGNAIKFRRSDVTPEIQLKATTQGTDWHIQISDNGIGIEEKYLTRIFQPFKRLHGKKEYPGTGLGLSIVNKIVQQHGGSMQVTSNPGLGSLFTIILPKPQTDQAVHK
ncbi:ATP-binding protein [Magnetococcales bacterium HHB-1]